jgi:hypothetical protein
VCAAHAEAHDQAALGDDVDRGGDLAEDGGLADPVAGHQQPQPQAGRPGGQGAEEGPALQDLPVPGTGDRYQVVPQPGVRDLGQGVGLLPHPEDLRVGDAHRGGLDAEGHAVVVLLLGHGPSASRLDVTVSIEDRQLC